MAMISPGPTSSASTRSSASVTYSSVMRTVSIGAVGAAPGDRLALAERAVAHAAERDPADVGRRVEVGDQRLERDAVVVLGRGDVVEQHLEQRLEPSAPPGVRR